MKTYIDLSGNLRLTISQAKSVLKVLDATLELGSHEQKAFFGNHHGGACAGLAQDKIRAALIRAGGKA